MAVTSISISHMQCNNHSAGSYSTDRRLIYKQMHTVVTEHNVKVLTHRMALKYKQDISMNLISAQLLLSETVYRKAEGSDLI
jgi:hypothetical protein